MLSLALLAILFVAAGVYHFVNPAFYVRIMPDFLPAHETMVWLSGVFEILGGIGLLVPATRTFAAWGLIAMLLVFLLVHVPMALNPAAYGVPAWALWLRIPLQFVLIWWIWRAAGLTFTGEAA
ncbi:MAG: DoxX family protein [Bacteroidota bacterium]